MTNKNIIANQTFTALSEEVVQLAEQRFSEPLVSVRVRASSPSTPIDPRDDYERCSMVSERLAF